MKPWENYFNPNVPPVANFTYSPMNPTDMDTISFTDLSYDSDGSIVNYTWNFGDGSISYEQNPQHRYADDGTYDVTLTVTDDDGATDTTIKSITVSNVPPVAINDTAITDEDTGIVINVSANDHDTDGILNLSSIAIITSPTHGNAIINANGTITYIPDENYYGYDEFSYTIKDDDGATSNVAYVNITVNPLNDAPVANDDNYTTDEDTTLVIDAPGVLANDNDVDGDALTAVLTSNPSHGSLTFNSDGSFVYTPNANYYGTDSFTYKAYDGTNYSNIATVTITINSVNLPPVVNFSWHPVIPKIGQNITFDASLSYDSDGSIVNYTWYFGDGSIAYGKIVYHSYEKAGKYNVTLVVTDDDGATANVTKRIRIIYPPSPPKPPELPEPWVTIKFNGSYERNGTRWLVTPETKICFDMDLLISNGIIELFYQIDDEGWEEYKDCFNLPLGRHFIYYYGKDENGLKTSVVSICIEVVESLSPTTLVILNPLQPDGNNGWYRSIVTISFEAYDDAGINATYYRIDDGKWMKYESSIKIGSDGKHVISFYSIDEYGNKESIKTKEIKIDKTAPQISFKKPSNYLYVFGRKLIPLKNTIIIGKAFVEIAANDNIGIEKVEFYIDGELKATMQSTPYSWQWNEIVIGKHEIMAKAYDEAGNVAIAKEEAWIINI
ncbi:MAG: tandem-95 repeat protein, partial [Thermoplasmata archaeon]|nr:tandem-95 repeat protein [Thermoplasmata archaeon]